MTLLILIKHVNPRVHINLKIFHWHEFVYEQAALNRAATYFQKYERFSIKLVFQLINSEFLVCEILVCATPPSDKYTWDSVYTSVFLLSFLWSSCLWCTNVCQNPVIKNLPPRRKCLAKQGESGFIFLVHDPSLFKPEHLHGTAPNHDFSPESSELTSWGVWKVLFVLVNPRENKEDAEPSHWRAGTPLAPQEMVLLRPWKHSVSCSFSFLTHSNFLLEFWSFSQLILSALVSACPGLCWEEATAHDCDVMTPVCLHPQSTPPLYLSGVLAVLPGHSSLCAFPDLCSLLMPVFRSMVLLGTATLHLLSRRVGRSCCWDALRWMNTWEDLLSESFPAARAELQGWWGKKKKSLFCLNVFFSCSGSCWEVAGFQAVVVCADKCIYMGR